MQHSTIAIAVVIVLVGWRVVARARRLVARQASQLWRHRAAVLVFPFLVGLLFVGALGETPSLLALAGGAATGGLLALVGFRQTRFEAGDDGSCFYTPSRPIGATLAALLVIRISYHAFTALESGDTGSTAATSFALTPMTLFIFSTFASYYGAFSLGLLLWRARVRRQRAKPD